MASTRKKAESSAAPRAGSAARRTASGATGAKRPVASSSAAKKTRAASPRGKASARAGAANGKARRATSLRVTPSPQGPASAERSADASAKPKSRVARGRNAATAEKPAPRPTPRRRAAARAAGAAAAEAPHAVDGLSEEDQIRAAKYLPRELPRRLFEEERFIFPETYGVNRIRLLVRDPEWIFAYWDVSPAAMKDFAKSIGERALALSRLTLRVVDPVSGGSTDILLPPGARWWYVRTDLSRRTYRAELGVTLPSGEFRRLAESNTVVTPRVGPSPDRARRRLSYPDARELPLDAAAAASEAEKRSGVALEPWAPGAVTGAESPAHGRSSTKGGASDTFRPGGASDAFPGASDTFRR
jgi:hypothetical protein